MQLVPLALDGLVRIHLDVLQDARGFFTERYNRSKFEQLGLPGEFVQDNHSRSMPGVLRGLHYQTGQGKLVGIIAGAVWDVVVDLRADSPTFGHYHTESITQDSGTMLWIPSGFAHGFCVMGDVAADMIYKVDRPWSQKDEGGIVFNDPTLNIPWPVRDPIVSDKDARLPAFAQYAARVGR